MKNIVTIWGWNWHSSILKWLYNYFSKNNSWGDYNISAIVSMSDDWRTTWLLMREMKQELGIHMPPPGDLRRCFFSLSDSEYRDEFEKIMEYVIDFDDKIKNLKLIDILEKLHESEWFINNLSNHDKKFLNFSLPLNSSIKWHKFWNILMAILFYNLKDYNKMVDFMSFLLDVKWQVLPITTHKAFIQAVLTDGTIIETQDKISNEADYSSKIKKIELMENSKNAKLNAWIKQLVKDADLLIIWPWDLFTSIDANFIIDWFEGLVKNSKAKKLYILNSNNKKWETTWYNIEDFVSFINKKIWKINYLVWNNKQPELNKDQEQVFKNDISVKWWDFLILNEEVEEKIIEKYDDIEIVSWDYVDVEKVYKYNEKLIEDLMKEVIK